MTEHPAHHQYSSPLETLVRRASSKRIKRGSSPTQQQLSLSDSSYGYYNQQQSKDALNVNLTPPRNKSFAPPTSPLLHAHFRSSVATATSFDRYSQPESRSSTDQDDDSVYSDTRISNYPSDRESWHSTATDATASPGLVLNLNSASGSTPAVVVTGPEPDSASLYGTMHPDPHPPPNFFRSVSSSSSLPHQGSKPSPTISNGFSRAAPHGEPALRRGSSSRSTQQQSPQPQTPQEYLQLGIQHHEANRLDQSAICFEKSAKEWGGCGVGMLMYGLTLRHGWGCPKNEKSGLHWLQKAAESAVVDLENGKQGVDATVVQSELVIAIYEVGQSFFQGWGVQKDKKMGVSYFQVAARLGDPDAQQSLAFCLANGKGCKKDRKEAAKWYRAAVAQGGISDVGLAWIYKDKYS